jgi:hypothetical protein
LSAKQVTAARRRRLQARRETKLRLSPDCLVAGATPASATSASALG